MVRLPWVQSSLLWQYFLSYAYILKIKRIKRYHIKGIGSPLLISINVIFDQETEKKEKKNDQTGTLAMCTRLLHNNSYLCRDNSKEQFIGQIDLPEVLYIKEYIDSMEPSRNNINTCTYKIGNLFEKAAQSSLNIVKNVSKRRPFDKPWYGPA